MGRHHIESYIVSTIIGSLILQLFIAAGAWEQIVPEMRPFAALMLGVFLGTTSQILRSKEDDEEV